MPVLVMYVIIIMNVISLILNFITNRNLKKTKKEYVEAMKKLHSDKEDAS